VDTTLQDPLVGQLLDRRYQVVSRLARGGMATVYEAVDTRLDRTVALKVMHPGLASDDEFVSRFIREAKAAARLSHPNVVAVFDQGSDNGTVFLAMEYVAGRTLRDLLQERVRLSPREAFDVLEPVLAALGAAHEAGLVHRDVKPENVLLADDGRVKVADFGLARAVSTASSSTATQGVLIGTVAYLAPEQVLRGIADPRSDVYAAGILLFEMLTGTKPFDGDSPIQVAYQHVHEDFPSPSHRLPGLPAQLDALVARATNRDPDDRPADAELFLAEVVQVRRSLGPEALAGSAGGRPIDETLVVAMDRGTDRRPAGGAAPDSPYPAVAAPDHATAPRRARTRRLRGGWLALLLVLLLTAALSGVAWWMAAGPGRYTSTPALVNLTRAEATSKAQQLGFSVHFADPRFSETVEPDHVLETDPAPNARISKDATITLTMSKGKERYAVPALVGLSQEQAEAALAATHLGLGEVSRSYSDTVAAGKVISSAPGKDTLLRRDEAVALVVSRGLPPVAVPKVVGASAEDAKKALTKVGFKVAVTEQYDEQVAEGKVISQQPARGTALKGATVRLVVSKGPPLVTVPNVVGSSLADALSALRRAGFETRVFNLPAGPNRVLDQSPNGGTAIPKGSRVTLSVF
jgi:serine/threonine-protein kinase